MEGSPTLVKEQWPGIPFPIDAAVFYDGCEITLLFLFQSDKKMSQYNIAFIKRNTYGINSYASDIDTRWFSIFPPSFCAMSDKVGKS